MEDCTGFGCLRFRKITNPSMPTTKVSAPMIAVDVGKAPKGLDKPACFRLRSNAR